jgi:hypothetical protein
LLLWGLTFPVLLFDPAVKGRARWLFAWALLAVLCAVCYFHGYIKPPHHPEFAPAVSTLDYVRYLLAFLGGEVAYALREHAARANFAIAIGGVLFALYCAAAVYAAARWRDAELVRRVVPWFAIGGYAIGCAFLAALGRIGFGIDSALSSRYITFSLYLSVAVVALAALIIREFRRTPERVRVATGLSVIAALLCCGYLALYALSFAPSIRRMHWSWANTRLSRAAIMLSEVVDTSEVIKRTTYPDPPSPAGWLRRWMS